MNESLLSKKEWFLVIIMIGSITGSLIISKILVNPFIFAVVAPSIIIAGTWYKEQFIKLISKQPFRHGVEQ